MTARTLALAAGASLALLLAGALTGCATGPGAGFGTDPGDDVEVDVDAAWLDAGRLIGIVTYGSSSCVPFASGEESVSGDVLTVELVDPENAACTRDLVPRASLVAVPEGVDPSQDLEIRVIGTYAGETDLDGVPGLTRGGETDYLPSAGWTGEDDQFVLLTWGSSSCAPVVEDVTASGPAEVTVTFVTPPENQVCTADMAARALVIATPDLDEDADVFVVLAGSPEFDNVRVPILGEN